MHQINTARSLSLISFGPYPFCVDIAPFFLAFISAFPKSAKVFGVNFCTSSQPHNVTLIGGGLRPELALALYGCIDRAETRLLTKSSRGLFYCPRMMGTGITKWNLI